MPLGDPLKLWIHGFHHLHPFHDLHHWHVHSLEKRVWNCQFALGAKEWKEHEQGAGDKLDRILHLRLTCTKWIGFKNISFLSRRGIFYANCYVKESYLTDEQFYYTLYKRELYQIIKWKLTQYLAQKLGVHFLMLIPMVDECIPPEIHVFLSL